MVSELKGDKLTIGITDEGALVIKGRSVGLENQNWYNQIISRCQELATPVLSGTVRLDYINCASYRKIYELFQVLDNNPNIGQVEICFLLEENDEDLADNWKLISKSTRKIQYKLYTNQQEMAMSA